MAPLVGPWYPCRDVPLGSIAVAGFVKALVLTAMYPRPERPNFGTFVRTQVESLRDAGVEVDVLFLDGPRRKLICKGMVDLRRRIRANPPDLVHAHHGYVGAMAITQRRVPVVITYHGSDVLGAPDAQGNVSLLRRDRRLTRSAAHGAREVIVQSDQMARLVPGRSVHTIPHEVDLETFRPMPRETAREALGLDADRPYVLFAAPRSTPAKNFPLAHAAVEAVRRGMSDVELLVVDRETQARLALYMNACDVLVFPSWQEGSPNLIKQALACNLPIVSTDVGDVRDMLGGTVGCHVVPRDVDAFSASLTVELGHRRRTAGRSRVAHLFEIRGGEADHRRVRACPRAVSGSAARRPPMSG